MLLGVAILDMWLNVNYCWASMANISSHIKDDLIARIRTGQEVTDPLTLTTLSERYQVSLTPVRIAVKELVAQGYLIKGVNRRLTVNRRRAVRGLAKFEELPEPPKD